MKVEIHHYHHSDQAVEQKLDRIIQLLIKQENEMALDFTKLTADVAAESAVDTNVQNILLQLSAAIQATAGQPNQQAQLDALTAQMETNAAALGQAAATAATVLSPPAAPAPATPAS